MKIFSPAPKKGKTKKCYTINNESGLSLQFYEGESEFCAHTSEEILIFLKLFRKEISLQFSLTLSTKMMKRWMLRPQKINPYCKKIK